MSATLHAEGYVDLPPHLKAGGFDHADIFGPLLYVAHTANDTVDVIDMERETYLQSLADHAEAAGVLVSAERRLVFVSNRAAGTVTVRAADGHHAIATLSAGLRPNGLAYDAKRDLLLVANVGDPARPETHTLSIIAVAERRVISSLQVAGRTRWTIFAPELDTFFVNISEPAQIVAVAAESPDTIARIIPIPASGPHGLGYNPTLRRLFCACDGRELVAIDATSGEATGQADLAGVPDVVFFNPKYEQLYVAIGDPGCLQVIDTQSMRTVQSLATERGAKTAAFDAARQRLYVFLPQSHRAMVYTFTRALHAHEAV